MKNKQPSKRLSNKSIIFQILKHEPALSGPELQRKVSETGITLSLISAYRALKAYRQTDGQIEKSETRCIRLVASILQDAAPGEHLSAKEILGRTNEQNAVHKSSIYRALERLSAIGLILRLGKGRQTFYEWKREGAHHGHLTCIACNRTIEFHQEYLDEVGQQICSRWSYDFVGIEFIVQSVCEYCRASSNKTLSSPQDI